MEKETHEEVVFGVFEHHIDRLVFQDNLSEHDYILVLYLPIQLHIPNHYMDSA